MTADDLTPEARAQRLAVLQTDPDFRLRCVEIAERSVYYTKRRETASGGFNYSELEDKPLREVLDRADRIAQYCLNADPPANLIEKLRQALCSKD